MTVTRTADHRVATTPNAVMTTLASPTVSGTDELSVWRVAMDEGQQGPLHVFDAEQVWVVLRGTPTVALDGGDEVALAVGDAVTFPAGVRRRIGAGAAEGGAELLVSGPSRGQARAIGEDGEPGDAVAPPWLA